MVSSSAELPAYDAGWGPEFQRAADFALVVEGEELPVLATLLDAHRTDDLISADEQDTRDEARQGGAGTGNVSGAASSIQRRLAAPFVGYSLAAARIFLGPVYHPTMTSALLQQQPWEKLLGALRLAHQLDAPRIASLLERSATAKLGVDGAQQDHWLPALAAADALQQQAPRLYERVVALAASALLLSMGPGSQVALQAQQLLADDRYATLSARTVAKLLDTFAGGVRAAAASGCQWDAAARSLAVEGEHRGTYTWNWCPGSGSADPPQSRSPSFTVGGIQWNLLAYINTWGPNKGYLAVYLERAATQHGPRHLAVTYLFKVKDLACGPTNTVFTTGERGWGWHKTLLRAELGDPASGSPPSAFPPITIRVELSFHWVDMPTRKWAWPRLSSVVPQRCRQALRRLAALLLSAALPLLVWGACVVAYHCAGWRDEGYLAM